jgi:FkbM family methyltransferase
MAESWRQSLRRGANRILHPAGLHLARRERAFEMDGLLGRAARRGVTIATWIDVGASDGSWAQAARKFFPRSRFLLFEPLAERQPGLARLRERLGFEVVAAAAGSAPGQVEFVIDPDLDGSGVAPPGAAGTRRVPVETIDRAVQAHQLPGPYGIKLDTHGYEVAALEGAAATLAACELLVIEAYNFTLTPGCLRFNELCTWLEARGFRCCDLADPMRRPSDGALWQMDLAFARATDPIFARNSYP